jgi:putative transposase
MVSPPMKREGVEVLMKGRGQSQRRACELVGIGRSSCRYTPKLREGELALRKRIRELASAHREYGFGQIFQVLDREGCKANHKRLYRLWKSEKLQLPRRSVKKRGPGPKGEVLQKAEHINHVWSYDFMEDRTANSRRLRILNVMDEYTTESLAIRIGPSMSSARVISVLEWLVATRGAPEYMRSDNGPEFIAKSVRSWLDRHGCKTIFIKPGSPWENPYIESFNGKLRTECLNRHVFMNGKEAQEIVEKWRQEYNAFRPKKRFGGLSPAMFAATAANSPRPSASSRLPHEKEDAILSL